MIEDTNPTTRALPLSFGVPELDTALGGGLFAGHIAVLVSPKTPMARAWIRDLLERWSKACGVIAYEGEVGADLQMPQTMPAAERPQAYVWEPADGDPCIQALRDAMETRAPRGYGLVLVADGEGRYLNQDALLVLCQSADRLSLEVVRTRSGPGRSRHEPIRLACSLHLEPWMTVNTITAFTRSALLAQRARAGNATRIRFLDTGATTLPPAFFSDTPRTVSGSFFDLAGGSFGAACRAVVVRGDGPERIVTERDDAASVWLLAECMRVRLGMPHEVPASEASQETAAALDPFTLRVIGDLVAEARRGLPLQGEGGLPIAMVRLLRALDALTTAPEGPPRVRASIRQSALRQSAIHCCAPVPGAPHTDSAGK